MVKPEDCILCETEQSRKQVPRDIYGVTCLVTGLVATSAKELMDNTCERHQGPLAEAIMVARLAEIGG